MIFTFECKVKTREVGFKLAPRFGCGVHSGGSLQKNGFQLWSHNNCYSLNASRSQRHCLIGLTSGLAAVLLGQRVGWLGSWRQHLTHVFPLRGGIETWFGCLKTRGFCLESTHLKDRDRLKKFIALLTLAFCWAHRVGQWCVEHQPLKIKKHGCKARSIFRTGFDVLRQILLNLHSQNQQYPQVLNLLSCI